MLCFIDNIHQITAINMYMPKFLFTIMLLIVVSHAIRSCQIQYFNICIYY